MGHTPSEPKAVDVQAATAHKLKHYYGLNKKSVTGSEKDYRAAVYSTNKTYNSRWTTIASWVLRNGIDPRAYVDWCFQKEFPGYPMPSKFASDSFQREYLKAGRPDPEYSKLKLKYELMVKRLERLCETADLVECLTDPLNTFDPFFIYVIARKVERHHELPQDILLKARHQVHCMPVYAEKFKEIVPEELFTPWT